MDTPSLAVVGISHHTAEVSVRERFTLEPPQITALLLQTTSGGGALEAVLLSTCNRTELYLVVDEDVDLRRLAVEPLARAAGYSAAEAEGWLYCRRGQDVVHHLFRVVSSLDSMVLGEPQIQGQVKDAYELAAGLTREPRVVGPLLSRMFQSALAVGGRVRSETPLGEGAASIPSAAVELGRKIFGSLKGKRALVVGAGEMSGLAMECLAAEGVKGMVVASRTETRAQALAERLGARAVAASSIGDVLAGVDIVATATSAPHHVLTRETVAHALPGGPRRPLFIIDMALPRDVEPEVGEIANVFLYDIDDLQQIVDANLDRRKAAIPLVESMVEASARDYWAWYTSLAVVPTIRALRQQLEGMRRAEVDKALRSSRLQDLDPVQREAVEVLTRQILNKVMHSPTTRLREAATNGRGVGTVEAARFLFGLAERAGEPHADPGASGEAAAGAEEGLGAGGGSVDEEVASE